MSFRVDLWKGYDIIRDKILLTHKQIKSFSKLLLAYVSLEKEHCKNLDNIYKEFKEIGNMNFPIENSRINIIEMLDFESKERKEFYTYISKNIIEKMQEYLSEPKIKFEQKIIDGTESTVSFNKYLDKLIAKQDTFHSQCKELCSFISQSELDNNMDNKASIAKYQKLLSKVIKYRSEYLISINETNIERNKHILKCEDVLNDLEKIYREYIGRFKQYLFDFAQKKYSLTEKLYNEEKNHFENSHSKIDIDKEVINFIIQNATKEFPMVKIEFCPLRTNAIGKFIKSKYHNKINDKDYNKVLKSIQEYFKKKNVFPDNLIQTGISRNMPTKNQFDFFSTLRFKKSKEINQILDSTGTKLLSIEDKIKDKSPEEKDAIIMHNIKFIKNYINELITNGKVKLYEDKLITDENIFKLDIKINDSREKMDINEKMQELENLIRNNESSAVYIETLLKTMSFLRSKGYFEINKFNYTIFQLLFLHILEANPKNDYILKNILILAQTFYYVTENGDEKIYLQKGIKDNEVLKLPETWHRCINYTMCLANTDKDLTIPVNKSDFIKKIDKEAKVTVISYLCDLRIFTESQYTFDIVKYYYSKLYNLDEKDIEQNIEDYLKNFNERLKIKKSKKINKINETKGETKKTKGETKEIKGDTKEIKEETKGKDNEIKEIKDETKSAGEETKGKEEETKGKEEETKGKDEETKEIKEEKSEITEEKKELKEEKNEAKEEKNETKEENNETKEENNETKEEKNENQDKI